MDFSLENIKKAYEEADAFLERNGIDTGNRLCYKLLIEEWLLDYRVSDPEADFEIKYQTKSRKIRIIFVLGIEAA